jgi:hypothetical protein
MILINSESPVEPSVTHIREMTQGNINNAAKDRFPLWNDVSNNNLNKPFYHGIVGPRWRPINAEINNGKNMISSPMPKPENYEKVIASEYPEKTFSRSYYDVPLRKDVQQINIPNAVTRVITERYDPRIPLKQEVEKVDGTLIHGTGSTVERIVHGQPSFLAKSEKKLSKHHKSRKATRNHKNFGNEVDSLLDAKSSASLGIAQSRAVYNRATENLGILKNGIAFPYTNKLYSHFERGSDMIIPVQMVNQYERQSLLLNEDAEGKQARIDAYRDTPAGVRSLHTYRRLK